MLQQKVDEIPKIISKYDNDLNEVRRESTYEIG